MSQNRVGEAWYDLGGRDAGLRKALDKAEADIRRSGAVAEAGFVTSMANIGGSLTTVGTGLQKTGRSMLTNLTLPLIAAGGAATHFALDFDTTMRRVVGLTDVTADQIDKIKQDILDLAPAVGKGPQELAEAFYFVASAGFKASEAMDVLRVAAESSASGLGTTQTIAQVLGGVLNAYGHENITAAKAADILTEAVSQGTAEADAFANVIGNVVPGAAALGVTFDQVTAALAGMTLSGVGAEEAATSLGQIFNSLLKPTSEAEDALHNMGLSSAGLRQELREKGLLDTLRTLDTAFAGNATAASLVFGNIRALRGVNALLTLDEKQLADVFDKVTNSVGRQAQAYKETEGPQRDMARAMADIEVTAIQLGDDVLPMVASVLADIAGAARGLRKWWDSLDEGMRKNIVQWLAWAAIAGPILLVVGKLVSAFGALFSAVQFLAGSKGIPALVTAAKNGRLAMLGWAGAVLLLTAGLEAAAGPISDFFDQLTQGKKANKTLHELNDLIGDMQKAGLLRAMGIDAKEFALAIERAGGDAEAAFQGIKDAGGDLGKAIDQLSLDGDKAFSGMVTGFGRNLKDARAALRADGEGIPQDLAATLEDGKFVVKPAAKEGLADPVKKALDDAVVDAGKQGQAIIDALSSSLAKGPEELQDELDALAEALRHPYVDFRRRADIEAALASKTIRDGLNNQDAKIRADTAKKVEDLLAQYNLLAPGALAAGQLVNPALKSGIDSNLQALLTYIRTFPVTNIEDAFKLADALEGAGQDGLAAYVRGMEMARLGKMTRELTNIQRDVHEKLDFSLYSTGYRVGYSYGTGLYNAGGYVGDAAQFLKNKVSGVMSFSGSPPFTHSRWLGLMVGLSFGQGIRRSIEGAVPGVRSGVARLTAALGPMAGGSAALGVLAGTPAAPVASQAVAGSNTQVVNHYYQLAVNGKLVTGSAEDEADALRRLAQLRVG